MLALMIIIASIVYGTIAFQVARHLTGHSKYREFLSRNRNEYYRTVGNLEDYDYHDEGFMLFMWFLLCGACLPLGLLILHGFNQGKGTGISIAPKHVRVEMNHKKQREVIESNRLQIAQKDAYIDRLERDLKVGEHA